MLIVYDPLYGEHLRGIPHPESPDRVETVAAALRERGMLSDTLPARDATNEEIERVHGASYVNLVETEVRGLHGHAGYLSTGDTVVDERSMRVARRAAGGAIVAAQTAYERSVPAFALVRPPGHHAEAARGMGFCVFNNAAIAARAIQAQSGARVLLIDFDYHHGNGTQAVSGNGLSYLSTHAYPAYPGTGGPQENYDLGNGDVIVNLPFPPHALGTEAFIASWNALLPQIAQRVRPDMLIVSAGFDYVRGDPVGDLGVDVAAAGDLAAIINQTAQTYCSGRVAYMLEGGYVPEAIASSVAHIVNAHRAHAKPSEQAQVAALPSAVQRVLANILS
ncbi:MAG TPA: histone deacetylase [Candidatus Baltobacteraceae bacterium]|jgi:acetoin utilization deacetylase AcuC-like enzyme|nr:histone deacetylase [Candidatus Baltobacteraceae bacterium]